MPTRSAGYLLVITAAVLWATIGVAGKIAFAHGIHPMETAFYRAAISGTVLLALSLRRPADLRIRRTDIPLFIAFGLISIAAFFTVYLYTVRVTTVATAAILLYTAPIFVAIFSTFLFREPFTRPKAAALGLAFVGCVLVVRGYDPQALRLNLAGILGGLASGLTYALYSIFGKAALARYTPTTALTYAHGVGALALAATGAPRSLIRFSHDATGFASLVYLALVTTLLAQFVYLSGLRLVPASRAAIVATVEPVVAAAMGFLLLGEVLEGPQVAGGVLVLAAVIWVQRTAEPAT